VKDAFGATSGEPLERPVRVFGRKDETPIRARKKR
jgi:hypothetical protein